MRDGCLIINAQPNSANFQGQWKDIMSLLAKLISLTARQTQDADGTDELVMSRAGGSIFERMSVRKDDEFDFDVDRLLPFDDQVEIVLTEVDSESHQHQNLGSVIIRADEHNRGVTQQFRGAGALPRCLLPPNGAAEPLCRPLGSAGCGRSRRIRGQAAATGKRGLERPPCGSARNIMPLNRRTLHAKRGAETWRQCRGREDAIC
jgi:hypothetical protein